MPDTQDQGLFNPAEPTPFEENVSYKERLVGEGKKFKDDEALARAKLESDQFIERLQQENAMLRGEIQQRETIEDIVQRLTPAKSSPDTANEEPREPGSPKNGLTPDEVKQLLSKELAEQKDRDLRSNNAKFVRQKLVEKYGPDWQTHLKTRQAELDVSEQYLTDLAQTQPKVFLSLLGETPKRDNFTPPSSVIDPAKQTVNPNVKDWFYYEKLRKENFREYMSPRVQNEMHDQIVRLGEAGFFRK